MQHLIEQNFNQVTLNGGIGLLQSIAMDNFVTDEENGAKKFQQEIKKDKEIGQDWKHLSNYITKTEIDFFPFFHMDAKGVLFTLPALLYLELIEESNTLLSWAINQFDFWNSTLNQQQRDCIIQVYTNWNTAQIKELQQYGMSTKGITEQLKNTEIATMLEKLRNIVNGN